MPFDPDEVVIDGMTCYVNLSEDSSAIQSGAQTYKPLAGSIRPHITQGVSCALAFPSMIIRPDIRTECFVVVLDSEVVIAWNKGLFRKTTQTEVLSRDQITAVDVETNPAGVTLLKIACPGKTVDVALPKGRSDLGKSISEIILPPRPATT